MIVEDADRLTEQACNALLKAIEEPTDRTVWMLCAPTVEDVLPDDPLALPAGHPGHADRRGRGRRSWSAATACADALASYAARASQGHIGRARALARDEATRNRRREVVSIPARLTSLGACMTAAANLAEVTKEEADLITSELDAREKADLDAAYGVVERGRRPREYAPALAALEQAQKTRAKRRHLDVVDRGLMDLVSVYRDAIAVGDRRDGAAGQRGDPRRRRPRSCAARRPSSTCAGSAGSSRPASRCWSSTSRSPLALESHDGRAQGARGQRPVRQVVAWLAGARRWCVGVARPWSVRCCVEPRRRRRRRRLRPGHPRRVREHAAPADEPPDPAPRAVLRPGPRLADCGDGDECATLTVPARLRRPRRARRSSSTCSRRPADDQDHKVGSLRGQPRRPGRARHVDTPSSAGSYFRQPLLDVLRHRRLRPARHRAAATRSTASPTRTSTTTSPATRTPTPRPRRAPTSARRASMGARLRRAQSGDLASHVSTVEAARDMDVLRAALGEQTMTYFGASYGTELGATYAELFPDRVGRLVLDGAVDPTLTVRERGPRRRRRGFETALRAYVQNCVDSTDACFLGSTGRRGSATHPATSSTRSTTSRCRRATATLTAGLARLRHLAPLYNRDYWILLSQGLQAAFDGDGSVLLQLADAYASRGLRRRLRRQQHRGVPRDQLPRRPVRRSRPAPGAGASSPDFEKASPTFGRIFAWGLIDCRGWPAPAGRPSRSTIDAAGAAPIVVVGTTRDPATPYAVGRRRSPPSSTPGCWSPATATATPATTPATTASTRPSSPTSSRARSRATG